RRVHDAAGGRGLSRALVRGPASGRASLWARRLRTRRGSRRARARGRSPALSLTTSGQVPSRHETGARHPHKKEPDVSHPITVLVVDDSDDILEVLEMALEAAGYRVIVAGDAVHAFDLVRGERPHVLLTDIMLGVTSGLDLITRVRSDLAPPLPAIIAMSGFGDVAREALRRGAGSFIPKPFVVDDLLDTIAAAADGRAPTPSTQQHAADAARHQRSVAAAA